MDVVLEVFDQFLFDPIYATILPSSQAHPALSKNASLTDPFASSETHTPWAYQPSSVYLKSLEQYLAPSRYAYQSQWPRDHIARQAISLFLITCLFGCVVYFVCATLSFVFVFDKSMFNHPKFLKNQIPLEIRQSVSAFPGMAALTVPFFLAEVRGYSKIYDHADEAPFWWYNILQFPIFVCFTDFFIYWIHRGLHHPLIYKQLHKAHHKWIMPTPYASHAFHPIDGWAQSVPYHVFPFVLPLQKFASVILFIFINVWTVLIHDGEYVAENPVINGAACHTMHHLYFNFNYGQFTTLWDRMCGSYRKPNDELFRADLKKSSAEWQRQAKEAEKMMEEVEGEDDRVYDQADTKKDR